jgi:hypothetical protein
MRGRGWGAAGKSARDGRGETGQGRARPGCRPWTGLPARDGGVGPGRGCRPGTGVSLGMEPRSPGAARAATAKAAYWGGAAGAAGSAGSAGLLTRSVIRP